MDHFGYSEALLHVFPHQSHQPPQIHRSKPLPGGNPSWFGRGFSSPKIVRRGWFRKRLEILNMLITLWLFNIAMENGPFIDEFPIKNGDFPWLC